MAITVWRVRDREADWHEQRWIGSPRVRCSGWLGGAGRSTRSGASLKRA